jgi:hypothetical protein
MAQETRQLDLDRELVEQADKLIPKSQSTIDRAKQAIQENEELLQRLKAERERHSPPRQ